MGPSTTYTGTYRASSRYECGPPSAVCPPKPSRQTCFIQVQAIDGCRGGGTHEWRRSRQRTIAMKATHSELEALVAKEVEISKDGEVYRGTLMGQVKDYDDD